MQEKVKFKVGDRIKMPSKRPDRWDPEGKMDKYLSTIQTINQISGEWFNFKGSGGWSFNLGNVTLVPKFNYYIKKGD